MRTIKTLLAAGLCLLTLAGCPADEEGLLPSGNPAPTATSGGTGGSGLSGGVSNGQDATPSATPTPTPGPGQAPQGSVVASPLSVTLYPEPLDPTKGLGLPTETKLSAEVQFLDGSKGPVRWIDDSGQLRLANDGTLTIPATASPGVYYVRAQAVVDAGMYQNVQVRVLSSAELEVTIR